MSQSFASRHDQKVIEVRKGGYSISSAGATISANKIVRNVLISIQEREYTMDLIVLPGLSISVILGMNWMKDHGVLIDTSTHTIMLREPKGVMLFQYHFPETLNSNTQLVQSKPLPFAISQWFVSFLIYSQRSYQVYHLIGMWNLRLSQCQVRHLSQEGLIGCHQMSQQNLKFSYKIYWTKVSFNLVHLHGDVQHYL